MSHLSCPQEEIGENSIMRDRPSTVTGNAANRTRVSCGQLSCMCVGVGVCACLYLCVCEARPYFGLVIFDILR